MRAPGRRLLLGHPRGRALNRPARILGIAPIVGIALAALAACGTRVGQLVEDPWPRLPDKWDTVPRPERFDRDGAALVSFTGGFRVEAQALLPGVISVRVARGNFDPMPSAALAPGVRPTLATSPSAVEAAALEATARLHFPTLPADHPRAWRWFLPLESNETIVGLGERPGSMLQRGRRAVMWNSDNFSYGPDAERLYQSIPFWITIRRGRARGIFIDDTHRVGFDVGRKREAVFEAAAEDGDFQVYWLEGPTVREVVERFAALTGRPPLPPLWALGYQQCRWSYATQDWVERVARGFRESRTPCDVLYTDIDYTEGFRSFTVSRERFPNFPGMIAGLGKLGFRIVSIVDPGLKVDPAWSVYADGAARGYYVKNPKGADWVGTVWPGASVFPDFTRPEVREWWGSLYAPLVEAGVAGFWNDMNEPSVFDGPDKTMAEEARHEGMGGGPHAKFHNIYGMLMARATREGIQRLRPESRPFVLTRANYAGGQRYAATWTGDNSARWPELKRSIAMTLNLGLCAQPFAGPDIGGFNTNMEGGGSPFADVTPELHARWLEFGALLPIARSHTIKDSMDREPYAYGEPWTSINRASIERRYRLLPYLYTLAAEAHETGAPIARPLLWIAADDDAAIACEDEFMLGDTLLVAPVVEPDAATRSVYLPAGTWYPFDPNDVRHVEPIEGPRRITVDAPVGRLPMFARAGAILPNEAPRQNTNEKGDGLLVVDAFAGSGELVLYEDAGEGLGFERGELARTPFGVATAGGKTRVSIEAREGSWRPPARKIRVRLHTPKGIREVTVDDDGAAHDLLESQW